MHSLSRVGRAAVFLLPVVCPGCRGVQSMFDEAGPEAANVIKLWWVLFGVGCVVLVVITFFLIGSCIGRRREREDGGAEHRLQRGIVIGGILSTLLLLIVLVATHALSQPFARERTGGMTIEVTGKRWWWRVTYYDEEGARLFETANEIHIPVGRPVRFRLLSDDVIHSFWVPKLAGKMDLIRGRTNYLWLQADEVGTYRGQCAEFCGIQHAKMAFLVIAHPPGEFADWLVSQAAPAGEPGSALAARGREVFKNSRCAQCHTIRGVWNAPPIGPDLTHLGARSTLAAGTLPNRRGHLAGWLANPQSVKPGNLMPSVPLPADDFQALLHYLEGLE